MNSSFSIRDYNDESALEAPFSGIKDLQLGRKSAN